MSEILEIKTLIETQGRAWEEYKRTNDELIKAKADGKAVSDLEAKLKSLDDGIEKAAESQKMIEDFMAKATAPGGSLGTKQSEEFEAEVKGFNQMLRAEYQSKGNGFSRTARRRRTVHRASRVHVCRYLKRPQIVMYRCESTRPRPSVQVRKVIARHPHRHKIRERLLRREIRRVPTFINIHRDRVLEIGEHDEVRTIIARDLIGTFALYLDPAIRDERLQRIEQFALMLDHDFLDDDAQLAPKPSGEFIRDVRGVGFMAIRFAD